MPLLNLFLITVANQNPTSAPTTTAPTASTTTVSSTCALQQYLDVDTGVIESPGIDQSINYPNNADCSWHIRVPAGKVVKITFIAFSLEQGYDFIR